MERNTGFIKKGWSAERVTVYSEENYCGEKGSIPRGRYIVAEKQIKSLQVTEFCRVIFYDDENENGQSCIIDHNVSELQIPFKPVLVVVETYAKGIIHNQEKQLLTGEYDIAELAEYERILLPRGFYALFGGKADDEHCVELYTREECSAGKEAENGYTKVQLFVLADEDICLNYKFSDELNDDDLVAVAGGFGFMAALSIASFVVPLAVKGIKWLVHHSHKK